MDKDARISELESQLTAAIMYIGSLRKQLAALRDDAALGAMVRTHHVLWGCFTGEHTYTVMHLSPREAIEAVTK